MFGCADRVILSPAVLRLCLTIAVPGDGCEAVLHGGVDDPRAEGDVAGLDILVVTYLLLFGGELGEVGGEALSLRPGE